MALSGWKSGSMWCDDAAHEHVLVDDAVVSGIIKQVAGANPDALVANAARMITRRFSTVGTFLPDKEG